MNVIPIKKAYEIDPFMFLWIVWNGEYIPPGTTYVLFAEDGRIFSTNAPKREGRLEAFTTFGAIV